MPPIEQMPGRLLPSFFNRPTLTVAPELLGGEIVRGEVRLRIIETEAYLPNDSACHAYRGRTRRNAPMWGPPGHAYIYLCYGIHNMLNFVTEADGTPAAVLIRGCVVISGHEVVKERRNGRLDVIGPGKVGQALALDASLSGVPLLGEIEVHPGVSPRRIERTPRIGIQYALPEHQAALWRFVAEPEDFSQT